MRYEVLDPLRVTSDGIELALGGPRPQLVLALLVSADGRTVSTSQLIDGVWSDDPPAPAEKTIQVYVHHLRGELGDALRTESVGYSLDVGREVDAVRFADLHREARQLLDVDPSQAAAVLREALALWNGPAYADSRDELALAGEVARLDELRIVALGDRIDADLALGRHADVIDELEGLTYEYPLQESFRAQYMTALHRAGRQVEALRAFERFRRYLAEEMGLDPSAELQRLEQQILADAPELTGAEPEFGDAPAGVRGYELRELVSWGDGVEVYRGYQRSVGRHRLEPRCRQLGRDRLPGRRSEHDHGRMGTVRSGWQLPGHVSAVGHRADDVVLVRGSRSRRCTARAC